jgi:hypothetical protein
MHRHIQYIDICVFQVTHLSEGPAPDDDQRLEVVGRQPPPLLALALRLHLVQLLQSRVKEAGKYI